MNKNAMIAVGFIAVAISACFYPSNAGGFIVLGIAAVYISDNEANK